MCLNTVQLSTYLPDTIFLGTELVGADFVGAELVRGRVGKGPSLLGAEFVSGRDVPESLKDIHHFRLMVLLLFRFTPSVQGGSQGTKP